MDLSIQTVALIFAACAGVAVLSLWLRQSVVVGYLLAGALLGPRGLGFVGGEAQVERLGDLGVIFLLFLLGTELSPERIRPLARPALLGGTLEIVLMIAATLGVVSLYGWGWYRGVFLGCVLAHNSTAILVKLLESSDGLRAPHGKFALGLSLFQDLSVVPMMVILPLLASREGEGGMGRNLLVALSMAAAFLALSFAAGRWVFPPFLARVAATKSQELFTLTVLALALGLASSSQLFGLSLAMGAFVAGLALGRSPFSQKVLADVLPFRDAFLSLFFVSVGMLLDWRAAASNILVILPVVGLILVLKTVVSGGVGWILGLPAGMALQAGLVLSQVGEFSFLLARMGVQEKCIDGDLYQIIITSSVITMALTPLLAKLGSAVSSWGAGLAPLRGMAAGLAEHGKARTDLEDHIIICGYGPVGRLVAAALHGIDKPFLVFELNPETVAVARRKGIPVIYGDARSEVLLEKAGIERARGVVVALPNVEIAEGVVRNVRLLAPTVPILARAVFLPHLERLRKAGATTTVHDEREAGRAITRAVLEVEGTRPEEVEPLLARLDRER